MAEQLSKELKSNFPVWYLEIKLPIDCFNDERIRSVSAIEKAQTEEEKASATQACLFRLKTRFKNIFSELDRKEALFSIPPRLVFMRYTHQGSNFTAFFDTSELTIKIAPLVIKKRHFFKDKEVPDFSRQSEAPIEVWLNAPRLMGQLADFTPHKFRLVMRSAQFLEASGEEAIRAFINQTAQSNPEV